MLERRRARSASKIAAAEKAITNRLNELPLSQENVAELQALVSAVKKLEQAKSSCKIIPFRKLK
jgi:hypothetical protein